jgi:hypothetical protein
MKTAIKARMMLPPRRPTKKKAAAKPCPTLEAISVALRRPRRVVRRPRPRDKGPYQALRGDPGLEQREPHAGT